MLNSIKTKVSTLGTNTVLYCSRMLRTVVTLYGRPNFDLNPTERIERMSSACKLGRLNVFSEGGWLVLTNERLFFRSSPRRPLARLIPRKRFPVDIPRESIRSARTRPRVLGILTLRLWLPILEIELGHHSRVRFQIGDAAGWSGTLSGLA